MPGFRLWEHHAVCHDSPLRQRAFPVSAAPRVYFPALLWERKNPPSVFVILQWWLASFFFSSSPFVPLLFFSSCRGMLGVLGGFFVRLFSWVVSRVCCSCSRFSLLCRFFVVARVGFFGSVFFVSSFSCCRASFCLGGASFLVAVGGVVGVGRCRGLVCRLVVVGVCSVAPGFVLCWVGCSVRRSLGAGFLGRLVRLFVCPLRFALSGWSPLGSRLCASSLRPVCLVAARLLVGSPVGSPVRLGLRVLCRPPACFVARLLAAPVFAGVAFFLPRTYVRSLEHTFARKKNFKLPPR